MYGYIDRTDESLDGWMDGWIDRWFDGWMVLGMNGWVVCISETIPAWARLEYGNRELR
jgi:hypothetical protein